MLHASAPVFTNFLDAIPTPYANVLKSAPELTSCMFEGMSRSSNSLPDLFCPNDGAGEVIVRTLCNRSVHFSPM
jgi:hypothetical protein